MRIKVINWMVQNRLNRKYDEFVQDICETGLGEFKTFRKVLLFALLLVVCHWNGMASNIQFAAQQRQQNEEDLARWKSLLDEYHQGKRNVTDGAAIIFHILYDYGMLGMGTTAEAVELTKEWNVLLAKHPEFMSHPPMHTSDEIAAQEARNAHARQLDEKAKSFVPKDTRFVNVLGHGNKMVLTYQYHVEFYQLPSDMTLERDGNYQTTGFHIRSDHGTVRKGQFASLGLKPIEVMSFRHPIESTYEVSGAVDFPKFIWVCDDLLGSYSASDKEENEILRRMNPDSGLMEWLNDKGQYKEFCGAVSLEGKVIYQLPIKQHLPDSLITLGRTSADGLSIDMQVGELTTGTVTAEEAVDAAVGETVQYLGNFRQRIIYTFPDKIMMYDEKDQKGIAKALKDHGF